MFSFIRIIYSFFNLLNFYPVTRFLITPLLVTCYCFQLLCLVTPVFVLKQQDLDPVIMLYTLMCKQQKRVGEFFVSFKRIFADRQFCTIIQPLFSVISNLFCNFWWQSKIGKLRHVQLRALCYQNTWPNSEK